MSPDRPPFASTTLDRDAATRAKPERLRAAWAETGARLLRLRGAEVPVAEGPERTRLALLPVAGEFVAAEPETGAAGHLFLGRIDGEPVFARVEEPAARGTEAPAAPGRGAGDENERWRPILEVGAELDEPERELVAVASALARWHEQARYSPRDGELTLPEQGGWARRDVHGAELFPRTDPAVIVLVEHEERVLLGSNALWETGRFSLLAGFVEAGESLEQAVVREVFEESGVRLGEVEYVTSQPWPFPRSLMLGFRARLAPGTDPEALRPDPEEISELRWFTREELRAPGPGILLPGRLSIARWMIERWIAEGPRGE
ncbi:NAD(+) diphosphatase [Leucobacter massiliensis]|uniref:NAD(+) diphosphatase n=1 Tax=Leucobacter massiliensis TaxID=1686285 RepID=A0A2S9QMR1_9MICO|nr:NAD(+) diphosphatase [Leucobacter massiliensis]PRI10870.1 hypothetical protein B4915_08250 [Leucobacter massiliensis]